MIHLFVCLSICQTSHKSVCPSIGLSLSLCPPSICLLSVCPSHQSVCLPVFSSVRPSISPTPAYTLDQLSVGLSVVVDVVVVVVVVVSVVVLGERGATREPSRSARVDLPDR